jgi:2-dehydro-3-deoxyglucarate aldolase/4-hydroxy-2-oxoheptanedioate aldolase
MAAEAGNDFIWIEMEHSHLDLRAALGHIMAVRGTATAPLVRVPYNDANVIKPYLDMAPAGIIVPMIRSADEVLQAVLACKYPPRGVRGFGPIRNMYGKSSMLEYLETADDEIMVFAHVETIEAVRDLDAILATPGLDGISPGRNDLSDSMGKLGQHSDPEVLDAIDTVFTKVRQTDLFLGCSIGYDADTVRNWYEKGVQWFALGEEVGHIFDGAKAVADAVHALDEGA